jgi:hypothetical protein
LLPLPDLAKIVSENISDASEKNETRRGRVNLIWERSIDFIFLFLGVF